MGSSRFWLKAADEESKSIPHEFPRSHWLKATGQCVLERYLSATMPIDLLIILYQLTKFEAPSYNSFRAPNCNTFRDIMITNFQSPNQQREIIRKK